MWAARFYVSAEVRCVIENTGVYEKYGEVATGKVPTRRAQYSETLRGALLSIGRRGTYSREAWDIYNYVKAEYCATGRTSRRIRRTKYLYPGKSWWM